MLTVNVPLTVTEKFDNATQKFVETQEDFFSLELEHSLVSLSKWESKFEKPFLSSDDKTPEEVFWYIQAMCLTPNVPLKAWTNLTQENLEEINTYINSKQTATWFNETPNQRPSTETITAELIYYWMVALQIPFECQHWHLNKLLTLVKVCNHKNQPAKKMSRRELAQKHRDLNAERKARYGTSG